MSRIKSSDFAGFQVRATQSTAKTQPRRLCELQEVSPNILSTVHQGVGKSRNAIAKVEPATD